MKPMTRADLQLGECFSIHRGPKYVYKALRGNRCVHIDGELYCHRADEPVTRRTDEEWILG